MINKYISQLNEAQQAPVLQKDGPMIIIAGFIGAHQIVSKYEWNSKKWFKNAIVFCCVLNVL